jgi:hypothetical protein
MVDAATLARDEATATSPKLNASTVVLSVKASYSQWFKLNQQSCLHKHNPSVLFWEKKMVKSDTSLCQISFNLLICRELNSNMTDTSQGRDETTFGKKILTIISEHQINH